MTVRHYFLLESGGNPPERWQRAFPEGRGLAIADVVSSTQTAAPAPGGPVTAIVWVPATGPAWERHLARLSREASDCGVVVLSSTPDDRQALDALQAGAKGYAHLYAAPAMLQEVALVIEHGGLWPGPGLLNRLLALAHPLLRQAALAADGAPGDVSMLSAREEQVARAVAAGLSNKEVASRLDISERTVKAHLGAAFEKLGLRDRLQLALYLSTGATPPHRPHD